jgi:hypothetical protein
LKNGFYLKAFSLWIHSFRFLSYDRPTTSSKWVLCRMQSSASSFSLQRPLVSLRSSSNSLCHPPCLATTSILSSIFPSVMCFRKQFPVGCDQSN